MYRVMVFRTSVTDDAEVQRLRPLLDRLCHARGKWNFDLEDCERILRVEGSDTGTMAVVGLLKSVGFYCEELPD